MEGMASLRIGFTSWRTVPLLFSSCLALIGALDRDAQKPFCYASCKAARTPSFDSILVIPACQTINLATACRSRQSTLRPRVAVLLPHDAFQEHAAHLVEWSTKLSSKGSERTCIRPGLTTFLHDAFTAHSDFVVNLYDIDIVDTIF